MMRLLLFFFFLLTMLMGQEIVVVADKNFPESNLTKAEIRSIFLDKKHFFGKKKVLVMNYEFNHPLRICFEKNILEKSERSLERYWRRAYYKGKRPPKIIKSVEMLFSYFENVTPSIGYVDLNTTLRKNIKILYTRECE